MALSKSLCVQASLRQGETRTECDHIMTPHIFNTLCFVYTLKIHIRHGSQCKSHVVIIKSAEVYSKHMQSSVVMKVDHSWSPKMMRTRHFGEEPATGPDPMHSVFLLCLSALPNMATCREEQTVRLSLRDARLLYIMFLACHGFFHSSLSYSKQSRAVRVLLIPRLPQTNLLL